MFTSIKNLISLFLISFVTFSVSAQISSTCSDDASFCEGLKTFKNGDTYDGEMTFGTPNGKGLMKFKNGNEYLGTFKEGKMHGAGVIILANGDSYEGNWKDGEANGFGTSKKINGSSFTGTFEKGMRHGAGFVTWENGDSLIGTWNDDRLEGDATFKFANSDVLETKWQGGNMNVKSIYKNNNGQLEGSMNTIYMMATLENDFSTDIDAIHGNLQTVWISAAMEFKANQNFDLSTSFLMAALKYGPADNERETIIVEQLKEIDNRDNSGWAQLSK